MPDDLANTPRVGDGAKPHDAVAELRNDVAYLRRQQHDLRSKFHGELAVLAVRIEDNDRRSLGRRKVIRRWAMGIVGTLWLWISYGALGDLLAGAVLLPGVLLVAVTLATGIALVLLILHNAADEQEHRDRYHNWFRLTDAGPGPQ